ncbi:hypothetical protein [Caulobacter sp. S45]|uniref:hypothetical protein n=1 Tax=Caulobacter sp. S45 TaxID=1641861 RepID=UPI00131E1FC6|nr:hypothetical protein [Caulobacter sp. S45]
MAKAPGTGLMGMLRGGRDDSSGPIWIPEIDEAHRAELGRLKRELRVLEGAQDDGRRNQPSSNATTPNAAETQIVGRIATGLRELNAWVAGQMGQAAAVAQKRVPSALTPEQARAEIDSRIGHVLAERRSDLVALREQELETQRDLNYFRRRHGLNRAASYRQSTLLPFAILVGAFVLESFVNAFLLRRISEQGWVGGVVLAGVISLVNISLGVMGGGVGWRLVGHRFNLQRTIGWTVTVAALVLAFFWNIYAAHFREVAEQAADAGTSGTLAGHALDALAHIKQHGILGLTSLFSWGLFALGLLIHLAASREAWDDMADRYWDYRRYDHAYRVARLDYEDTVSEAKAAALEESREVLADLEATYAPATQERDRLSALAELGGRRLAEARDAEAEWIRQGGALIKAYRDENAQVRSDAPPAYFAYFPDPETYRHGGPVTSTADLEVSRANAERAAAQMQSAAETAARVQADNLAALSSLRAYVTESADNLQTRIDGLKQSVDREADANLSRHAPPVEAVMPHDRAEGAPPLASGPVDDDTLGPLERAGGA